MPTQSKTKLVTSSIATSLTDEAIIAKVRDGDLNKYELIMRRYNQRLFRIARSILRNDEEARDAIQESYITSFTRLDQFKGPQGFGAWLSRITTNQALMRLRKIKDAVSYDEEVIEMDHDTESNRSNNVEQNPESLVSNDQLKVLLESHLDALPEKFRLVFVLRAIEHMSTRETSEVLEIKEETVKTRFHRAKQLMQAKLTESMAQANVSVYEFAGARCDLVVRNVMEYLKALEQK